MKKEFYRSKALYELLVSKDNRPWAGCLANGRFFEINLEENFFDYTIRLYTIYHMDEGRQEEAVRKLIKVTKPVKPVIIVYTIPNTIVSRLKMRVLIIIGRFLKKPDFTLENKGIAKLYFYRYPLEWWSRMLISINYLSLGVCN